MNTLRSFCWITWDFIRALIWSAYFMVLALVRTLWKVVCLSGKSYEHLRVLVPCGGLTTAVRLRVDYIMGHKHLALQSLEQLTRDVERYFQFHKEKPKIQKLTARVLLDLYQRFFYYALSVGHVDYAMACIIRAKKNLGVDELSSRLGVSFSTAQLVQVALSAAQSFDDGVLATVFYRNSSTGSAEASEETEERSGATTKESSHGNVIPFPVKHLKPSSCLSHGDRDKQT